MASLPLVAKLERHTLHSCLSLPLTLCVEGKGSAENPAECGEEAVYVCLRSWVLGINEIGKQEIRIKSTKQRITLYINIFNIKEDGFCSSFFFFLSSTLRRILCGPLYPLHYTTLHYPTLLMNQTKMASSHTLRRSVGSVVYCGV